MQLNRAASSMDSSKLTALFFILMLSISTIPQTLACDYCPKSPPSPKSPKSPTTPSSPGNPINLPPVNLPPVNVPPVGLPPLKPPFKLPPVGLPPALKPPYNLPPVGIPPALKPPYNLPPVGIPPVLKPPYNLPPVGLPPLVGHGTTPPSPAMPCPTPPTTSGSCPIDALKLGACVDVLGNSAQVGDPTVECCPVVDGLVGVAAAACLCTAIKAKVLDINLYLPIALQVLVACGAPVPAGYTCA